MKKTIDRKTHSVTVIGNHHYIPIEYQVPDWDVEEQACFKYKGEYYFLGEFMRIEHALDWMNEYHGYMSDSYFSGLLVRFPEDEYRSYDDCVQVYRYYS